MTKNIFIFSIAAAVLFIGTGYGFYQLGVQRGAVSLAAPVASTASAPLQSGIAAGKPPRAATFRRG